jgi:hypothetical protein
MTMYRMATLHHYLVLIGPDLSLGIVFDLSSEN